MFNYNNRRFNGGYSNGYRNGYNGGYNQRFQQPRKKRSGAKFGYAKGDNSKPFVRGWRATRRWGLITYMCGPNKGTHRTTSNSGREWENWTCKVTFGDGRTQLMSCLYDCSNRKVILKEAGITINPNAPNGGYCGPFGKKR